MRRPDALSARVLRRVEFGVLGPLLFRRDGGEQPVPTEILRRLLAVLLARAGGAVPVAVIVDALWPDRPPPTARRTLTVYVSRLRALVGSGVMVESPRGYYALHPGCAVVDASVFRSLVD
jgi:DNA-binding SARP family transcriptional activator